MIPRSSLEHNPLNITVYWLNVIDLINLCLCRATLSTDNSSICIITNGGAEQSLQQVVSLLMSIIYRWVSWWHWRTIPCLSNRIPPLSNHLDLDKKQIKLINFQMKIAYTHVWSFEFRIKEKKNCVRNFLKH